MPERANSATERCSKSDPPRSFVSSNSHAPSTLQLGAQAGLLVLPPHLRPCARSQLAPHCFVALRAQQLQKFARVVRIVFLRSAQTTANFFHTRTPRSFGNCLAAAICTCFRSVFFQPGRAFFQKNARIVDFSV